MLFSRESTICHREPQELMTAFRLMLSGVIWFSSATVQHSVTPLDSCWFQFHLLGWLHTMTSAASNDLNNHSKNSPSARERFCHGVQQNKRHLPFVAWTCMCIVGETTQTRTATRPSMARSLEYLQIARVVIIIYHVVDPLHFTDHIKMKAFNMLSFFAFYLGTGRQTAPVESDVRPFSQALMAALKAMRPVRPVPSSPSRPLRRFRSFRSFKNVKSSWMAISHWPHVSQALMAVFQLISSAKSRDFIFCKSWTASVHWYPFSSALIAAL